MNDAMVPQWMKKKQAEQELAEARAEAQRLKALAALTLIKAKMPEFCYAVKQKLAVAVDCLSVLKMSGQIERIWRRVLCFRATPGVYPNQTYTDVIFTNKGIECRLLNGGVYEFEFCAVSDTEIGVTYMRGGGSTMSPDQAAECIMSQMVEKIEAQ